MTVKPEGKSGIVPSLDTDTPTTVTFLRLRLLDQFRRAQKKGDRVAMIFLSQRLAKLT